MIPLFSRHIIIAGLVVFVDQISKYFVRELICPYESLFLVENIFYITHVQNPGAAFGLFGYQTEFLIAVSLLTIAVLALISIRVSQKERFFQTALGFIIGGATGNLIDRLSFGYVIDFLDLGFWEYRWPVFNVADVAITIGSIIIIWKLLGRYKSVALEA
jgi:signal peptidase II